VIAVYDAGRHSQTLEVDVKIGKFWRSLLQHRFRYVPSAFLLSTGCWLLLDLWNATTSTYICPLAGKQSMIIPVLQIATLGLDSLLAIAIAELSRPYHQESLPRQLKGTNVWASVLITAAMIWFIIGAIVRLAVPDDLSERLPSNAIFSISFFSSQFTQALSLSILYISAIVSVSQDVPNLSMH
jgi:hypothetical protein